MNIDFKDLEDKKEVDPTLKDFKHCIKNLAKSAKNLSKSSEGKKLPADRWSDIVGLIKKSKMAVSMIELGFDDDEIQGTEKSADDAKPKTGSEENPESADAENSVGDKENPPKSSDSDSEGDDDTSKKLSALGLKKEEKETNSPKSFNETAKSKSQQRLFGMVHAYNKGELNKSDIDPDLYRKVKKIASGMTDKDAKKIAKTNHDDLPEKVPTDEYYDTLNHLSILLSEENFDKVEGTGTGFIVEKDDRKFTIEFDQNFYMKSDNYNFDLGDDYDLTEVVDKFKRLSRHSDRILKKEYETLIR